MAGWAWGHGPEGSAGETFSCLSTPLSNVQSLHVCVNARAYMQLCVHVRVFVCVLVHERSRVVCVLVCVLLRAYSFVCANPTVVVVTARAL